MIGTRSYEVEKKTAAQKVEVGLAGASTLDFLDFTVRMDYPCFHRPVLTLNHYSPLI
jgi:hypothetical protein